MLQKLCASFLTALHVQRSTSSSCVDESTSVIVERKAGSGSPPLTHRARRSSRNVVWAGCESREEVEDVEMGENATRSKDRRKAPDSFRRPYEVVTSKRIVNSVAS